MPDTKIAIVFTATGKYPVNGSYSTGCPQKVADEIMNALPKKLDKIVAVPDGIKTFLSVAVGDAAPAVLLDKAISQKDLSDVEGGLGKAIIEVSKNHGGK